MKTIFEKIRDKEIPSYMLYEDEFVMAFLDISQTTLGHTLIVSKDAFTDILHTPDAILSHMLITGKKIANAIDQTLKPLGFNFLSNVREIAGQTVFHVHLHVIPRYTSNDLVLMFPPNNGEKNFISLVHTIQSALF
jgi:histidine triad (HIT) family protein